MSSGSYSVTELERRERVLREMETRFQREREAQQAHLREIMRIVAQAEAAASDAEHGAVPVAETRVTTQFSGVTDHASSQKVVSGFDDSFLMKGGMGGAASPDAVPHTAMEAVDFSGASAEHLPTEQEKKEAYAEQLAAKLSLMVPLQGRDAALRQQFTAYLQKLLADDSVRFGDFTALLSPRWADLQRNMELLDPVNDPTIEEYYALCALVGERPQPLRRAQRETEIRRLRKRYEKHSEQEYVLRNLTEVLEELGMHISGEMVMDGRSGSEVSDDALPDCKLFMSFDGKGVLFETIVEVDTENPDELTVDQCALVEERGAESCEKQKEIRRLMQERGIRMEMVSETKPKASRMKVQKRSRKRRTEEGKGGRQALDG